MKVVVGMSGGVDSSVAALMLKQRGYDVVGVSLKLVACARVGGNSCCSERDRRDARAICEALGIAHRTVDMSSQFKAQVIEPFVSAYLSGETPSPCIWCNERLKFAALFDAAKDVGADCIATGHYARVRHDEKVVARLMRGVDDARDQSYFLFALLKTGLERILFPLGDITKGEARAAARRAGLPVHDKTESREICFVPGDDYASFIEEYAPERVPGKGRFVGRDGAQCGSHRGIHAYTVGQRRGLGRGFGARTYVVRIDAWKNEVALGSVDELMMRSMRVRDVVWAREAKKLMRACVKIRSTHAGSMACIEQDDAGARVVFDEPERAISPGQAAVFYEDDVVVGGGWITQ